MTKQYSINIDNLPLPLSDELQAYLVEQYQLALIAEPDTLDVALYNLDNDIGFTLSFEHITEFELRLSHLIFFSNVDDVVNVQHYRYASERHKWLCTDSGEVATKYVRDSLIMLHTWHIDNELQVEIE